MRSVLCLLSVLASAPAAAFTVESFSPEGEAPDIRQITAAFSEEMIAFGDPNAGREPFTSSCAQAGQGRWIDPRHWVFDFKADLPAGVSCTLTLNPELKALGGSAATGATQFSFFTGGPTITDSEPYGYGIPEDSAFILTLNSDFDPASVAKFAYMQVPGVASKGKVEVLTGAEREVLLKAHFQHRDKAKPEMLKRIVIIKPLQNLPPGKIVHLVFGPGVATAGGVARTKAQKREYEVRAAFKVTFDCEKENADADCVPMTPMRVGFSNEVTRKLAEGIRLRAGAKEYKPKISSDSETVYDVQFPGPFPDKTGFVVTLPDGFADEDGRQAINRKNFPLKVRTAGYPPLAKFAAEFGIIEANAGPAMLPVTVRNIEAEMKARVYLPVPRAEDKNIFKRWYDRLRGRFLRIPRQDAPAILAWLDKLTRIDREVSVFGPGQKNMAFDPALNLGDKAERLGEVKLGRKDGKSFEVIGLPLGGPGFYVVETESRMLGESLLAKKEPMYVAAAALVTNLAVHFKLARTSSAVWVTTLDKGQPAKGALVSIWDCAKNLHFKGKVNDDGVLLVDKELPDLESLPKCFRPDKDSYGSQYASGLIVVAELGDDFSFAHTSWDSGIERYRFNLPYVEDHEDLVLHTILDRSLLRAGETVHLKTLLRRRGSEGFVLVPAAQRPEKLILAHEGSEQKFEMPLTFDAGGTATNDWQIPKDAKLGSYRIYSYVGKEETWSNQLNAGELRIDEFRIPLAKGMIASGGSVLVAPEKLTFDLGVQYLSGGGAGNQPITFRARLTEKAALDFANFEGYHFASEPIKVGESLRDRTEPPPIELYAGELTLDQAGTGRISLDHLPAKAVPFKLESELEYKDPSGEIQTVAKTQSLWPTPVVLGIKADDWVLDSKQLKFRIAAVDKSGKGQADVDIKVRLFKRTTQSHRKRLVGGFYSYESSEKVKALGQLCQGKTAANGEFVCTGKSPATGDLIAEAVTESDGKQATAAESVLVAGKDYWYFRQTDNDRIDVVPEKKLYEPGDTAKLQVRMPFKRAMALVTVEREGIQDVFVKKLEGKLPIVELKIKDAYAPNTYVSVLVVRGRIKKPEATFLVDLAKPTFRLGITPLKVGIKPYQLDVKVTTDKQTYQARDEVEAKIQALQPGGEGPGADTEAAVAVVDEGLLQLKPNDSWNLLTAMTGLRADTARTYTAAMQVIGKRHFGLKAVSGGGGGGVEVTRSLFDALVFWQSRVPLDKAGNATVHFKLNDSLTSFKVVAIVQAGLNRFGTGATSIAATKDIMVLPGIPPMARAGDEFKASFTLRNTTKNESELVAKLKVDGLDGELKPETLTLKGGQAREVAWTIKAPRQPGTLTYQIVVEQGGKVADQLVIKQDVKTSLPERTLQATLVQLDPGTDLPVERPAGAVADRGGVIVTLRPSLAGDFAGLTDYMKNYPYSCMEQRLSRAVALSDDTLWSETMAALPAYMEGEGLVKYYPSSDEGSPILTAYLLTLAAEAGKTIPDEPKARMIAGLTGFIEGRILRVRLSFGADLALQKLSAIDALSRHQSGNAAMLGSFSHDPELWPTSALIDWIGLLQRLADAPKDELDKAVKLLRARMTYRGTTLGFSTEAKDGLWWLMVSTDVNAVRLALLALEFELGHGIKDEIPKIVRSALARQGRRGHWDLTTANALGVVALQKFAARFEKTKPGGSTAAELAKQSLAHDWGKAPEGGRLELAWPAGAAKLKLAHKGEGKPWAQIESRAAVPLKAPVGGIL